MTKLLHFADLHLDRSFGDSGVASSEFGRRRRSDLRLVLQRIIDMAAESAVDVLTIAGDLYEHERSSIDTANFLRAEFERVSPTEVIIAPGNHDPYTLDSLYRQTGWPSNVTVIDSPTVIQVRTDAPIHLYGAAHISPSVRDNLVHGLRLPTGSPNVLLLHASDETSVPEGKSCCCPLSPGDLVQAGFDIALLGHYHALRLPNANRPVVAYPGSPEPLGFGEAGPHYVLLVHFDGDQVDIEKRRTDISDLRTADVDISGAESHTDVEREILRWAAANQPEQAYVQLTLSGEITLDVDLDLGILYERCSNCCAFMSLRDRTKRRIEVDPHEPTVRGRFVRKMQTRIDDATSPEQRRELENALFYGLQALSKREIRAQ